MKYHTYVRIMLAGLALATSGCRKKEAVAPQEMPPTIVQTATAEQRAIPVYVDAFGQLAAIQTVDIMPQVSGKLLEARFVEGARVSKGDVLFVLDVAPFQAELDKAKAQLQQDQASLKLKRDTLERNRKMIQQKLISTDTFEGYQTDVNMAEGKVQQDLAAVNAAQINVDYCTITSPIDGVTGKRLVDPGNIVAANSTKLVNLRTLDPIFVDFTVPEKYFSIIQEANRKGTLDINFVPERDVDPIIEESLQGGGVDQKTLIQKFMSTTYDGKLVFIDNTINNDTGTIALRAQADNQAGDLWPGQFVTLGLIVNTVENAVIVPGGAVLYGKQGPYAFVIGPDNKAQLRSLVLGPDWMGYLLIKSGIQAGEQVVTTGQLGLYPGAQVMIKPSAAPANAGPAAATAGDQ